MTGIFLLELVMGWIEIAGLLQPGRTNTSIDTVLPWLLLAVIAVPIAAFGEGLPVQDYLLNQGPPALGIGPVSRGPSGFR